MVKFSKIVGINQRGLSLLSVLMSFRCLWIIIKIRSSGQKKILQAYVSIPLACKSIDVAIKKKAVNSFYYRGNSMQLYVGLLDLVNRKGDLINIMLVVDKALSMIRLDWRYILQLRYFKKLSFEDIANKIGVCLRSVFRSWNLGLQSFSKACIQLGFDCDWFNEKYVDDPLFDVKGCHFSVKSYSKKRRNSKNFLK